jgi:hypothetical protein
MRKHIRLYEEYTDLEEKSLEKHYSWQDVRNAIQSKLPFIILDFKTEEAMDDCIKGELLDEKYIKQAFHLKENDGARAIKYPSVFIFGEDTNLSKRVLDLNKRFDILRTIIGEYGSNIPSLYVEGDQVDVGGNLFASNNIDELDGEDFYSIESKYYKFIS